jgi:hypothetical protein
MTINIADNSPRVSYDVAAGVTQSSFTVSFEFFDNEDLNVYVDGTLKTLTTDYTVTGGDGSTGTVTMSVTGAAGGSTVVITRDIDLERTTDFPASGAFNIATLNTELDRLIAIAADLDDRAARALQLTDYDVAVGLTLPELDDRKGTVLAFNSSTGAVEAGPTTTNVNSLADITDDIATLADIEDGTDATDAIQTVASISSNVTTVAGVSANVTTVAGNNANVTTVADNDANITTVAGISSNVTTVAGISSDVTTAAGISANITTVAGDSADIQALAAKSTEIGLLGTADAIADMNTLASSAIITDMDALADLTAEIDALGDVTADITTVSGISANVTTVSGISANVTTVAGVSSDVTTVAGISADVTTVAADGTDIGTVAGISSDVTTVSGISGNVTTVAGISANVTTVAGISANVTTVAGDTANIGTIATDLGGDDHIGTVAGSISNVNSVGGSIANVNTVATNLTSVNSFANTYRIGTTDPTTSLDTGDLFFNTSSGVLKVYNGSAWEAGVTAGSGFMPLTGGSFTGNVSFGDNDKAIFGAGSDLQIYHDGSDSYVHDAGTGILRLKSNGTKILMETAAGESLAEFINNGNAVLYSNNVERLRTNGTGVDISGTLTSDGLTVNSGGDQEVYFGDATDGIALANTGAVSSIEFGNSQGAGGVGKFTYDRSIGKLVYAEGANGSEEDFFAIDNFGKIGIGTTTPTRKLDVESSEVVVATLVSTNSANYSLLRFLDGSNTTEAAAAGIGSVGEALAFQSSGSERMRIDSSGNLLVGTTTSPSGSGKLALAKGVVEKTTTVTYASSIALTYNNGSIQTVTLTGNVTFTDSLADGEAIVLMLNAGASYTVTWTAVDKWVSSSGNAAPTLTANDTIVLWKIGSTVYAAYAGSYT